MIAMRGLVIALKKKEVAASILRTFLQYIDQGMLPNRFPDQGEQPAYNTIDATLWLFVALHDFVEKFNDTEFVLTHFPLLTEIIERHIQGTRYGIHVTKDGLLSGGEGSEALTWMDARVGEHTVTPRHGCPVEINALWYNALMIYNAMARRILKEKSPYMELAKKVKKSFIARYWNSSYLNDVVQLDDTFDARIRPNQIYAISLPYSLLNKKQTQAVLNVVKEKLVTPLGLRTLDPEDPAFVPIYQGDPWHRDHAYHQGTVWPFLIGEYWMALMLHENHSVKAKKLVLNSMTPLLEHFYSQGALHGIAEVFDGLTPGDGKGCIHQAWSVGMMLKVLSDISERESVT
jgi:predicted glycogen debranching enzyme